MSCFFCYYRESLKQMSCIVMGVLSMFMVTLMFEG